MSDIFCREEKNSNLKQRAQTVSFGTFFCRIPAHETTLIGQRKSGVPGNHRPIGLKSINGPVGCCWAHSVICDYKGQSDVAGDGECRFTPVENYTSAGLKGLTHLHARAHTRTHTHVPFRALHTGTCTHISSANTHMYTHLQSKASGEFHWTQGAVEFHRTCQGFHAKLPFNGILNGRNLAQCFSSCSVPDLAPSDII